MDDLNIYLDKGQQLKIDSAYDRILFVKVENGKCSLIQDCSSLDKNTNNNFICAFLGKSENGIIDLDNYYGKEISLVHNGIISGNFGIPDEKLGKPAFLDENGDFTFTEPVDTKFKVGTYLAKDKFYIELHEGPKKMDASSIWAEKTYNLEISPKEGYFLGGSYLNSNIYLDITDLANIDTYQDGEINTNDFDIITKDSKTGQIVTPGFYLNSNGKWCGFEWLVKKSDSSTFLYMVTIPVGADVSNSTGFTWPLDKELEEKVTLLVTVRRRPIQSEVLNLNACNSVPNVEDNGNLVTSNSIKFDNGSLSIDASDETGINVISTEIKKADVIKDVIKSGDKSVIWTYDLENNITSINSYFSFDPISNDLSQDDYEDYDASDSALFYLHELPKNISKYPNSSTDEKIVAVTKGLVEYLDKEEHEISYLDMDLKFNKDGEISNKLRDMYRLLYKGQYKYLDYLSSIGLLNIAAAETEDRLLNIERSLFGKDYDTLLGKAELKGYDSIKDSLSIGGALRDVAFLRKKEFIKDENGEYSSIIDNVINDDFSNGLDKESNIQKLMKACEKLSIDFDNPEILSKDVKVDDSYMLDSFLKENKEKLDDICSIKTFSNDLDSKFFLSNFIRNDKDSFELEESDILNDESDYENLYSGFVFSKNRILKGYSMSIKDNNKKLFGLNDFSMSEVDSTLQNIYLSDVDYSLLLEDEDKNSIVDYWFNKCAIDIETIPVFVAFEDGKKDIVSNSGSVLIEQKSLTYEDNNFNNFIEKSVEKVEDEIKESPVTLTRKIGDEINVNGNLVKTEITSYDSVDSKADYNSLIDLFKSLDGKSDEEILGLLLKNKNDIDYYINTSGKLDKYIDLYKDYCDKLGIEEASIQEIDTDLMKSDVMSAFSYMIDSLGIKDSSLLKNIDKQLDVTKWIKNKKIAIGSYNKFDKSEKYLTESFVTKDRNSYKNFSYSDKDGNPIYKEDTAEKILETVAIKDDAYIYGEQLPTPDASISLKGSDLMKLISVGYKEGATHLNSIQNSSNSIYNGTLVKYTYNVKDVNNRTLYISYDDKEYAVNGIVLNSFKPENSKIDLKDYYLYMYIASSLSYTDSDGTEQLEKFLSKIKYFNTNFFFTFSINQNGIKDGKKLIFCPTFDYKSLRMVFNNVEPVYNHKFICNFTQNLLSSNTEDITLDFEKDYKFIIDNSLFTETELLNENENISSSSEAIKFLKNNEITSLENFEEVEKSSIQHLKSSDSRFKFYVK